ncbi:dipeptide/oligopeptide/nickel ABC transporter ATP-binding protein [bacterium]|nr:dipeptide/oligopeptide/nickel ABC transporter ATP-binding protein [bacterium]
MRRHCGTCVLEIDGLSVQFEVNQTNLTVIRELSLSIPDNTVMGLVGESGSGKSVTALSILGLLPQNGRIQSGTIAWQGTEIQAFSDAQYKKIRGCDIGLVFQNPLSSLNPVFSIQDQFVETLRLQFGHTKVQAINEAAYWLDRVGIPDANKRLRDYPHQFSLGMCQRIMIALTLAMKPKLLIADEPTASLDVTIQAQILELLQALRSELGMSVLLISHDLGVIAQQCDTVAVMYLGELVECASASALFSNPKHPYTQALLAAIPIPDPHAPKPQRLMGELPSLYNRPKGCAFHTRCPQVMPQCKAKRPVLHNSGCHGVACWLHPEEL